MVGNKLIDQLLEESSEEGVDPTLVSRAAIFWGCKPEPQKFPSADQRDLSRAWSMRSCIACMTSSWVYNLALGSLASRRASSTSRVIRS